MKTKEKTLTCPCCESTKVIVRTVTSVYVNTMEHYCFSVKPQDSDAEIFCLNCKFEGIRADLNLK